MESENPKSELPRHGKREGALRRLGHWLYDLCFPFSERSHGYYGYSGPSRQNRVKWLWRRLRRQARKNLWLEASKDQLLLNDIAEIETDFKYADSETSERAN